MSLMADWYKLNKNGPLSNHPTKYSVWLRGDGAFMFMANMEFKHLTNAIIFSEKKIEKGSSLVDYVTLWQQLSMERAYRLAFGWHKQPPTLNVYMSDLSALKNLPSLLKPALLEYEESDEDEVVCLPADLSDGEFGDYVSNLSKYF